MYDIELWKRQKKALQLTFDELAQKSGVAISTIYAIFGRKTVDPRIETVNAIEKALEITDGITQEEFNAGWRNVKQISITPLEDEMLYLFREVGKKHGEQGQRALITVAEKML